MAQKTPTSFMHDPWPPSFLTPQGSETFFFFRKVFGPHEKKALNEYLKSYLNFKDKL